MIAALHRAVDRMLGRGEAAITVPPFDGALKPNQILQEAPVFAALPAPEDLASDGDALYVADGARVLRYDPADALADEPVEVARFDVPLTALACLPGGALAVALAGRAVRIRGGAFDGRGWDSVQGKPFCAVNAVVALPNGRLIVTDGSQIQPYERWTHDLMERGQSGRLIEIDPAGAARLLAGNLAYAFGAAVSGDRIWVAESWRHRLLALQPGALDSARPGERVLDRLPAYPSRLSAASGGGFWLTAFIARTQLVEFVLREPAYRRRMMREVDPRYWVAPVLGANDTFLEPMQGAHIKTMGILKPWAPPRSYGLVIRLTAGGLPRYALHSRVDGNNHGVVAAVELRGDLYVLAKGSRRILRLEVAELESRFPSDGCEPDRAIAA